MGITKTDFMRGMQCPKMLWLDKHKPQLKIIPREVQQILAAGSDFGNRAKAMFGEYKDMTVFLPGTSYPDKNAMAAKTAEHLQNGTPVICEAAFLYYNNYCAVDILKKTESGYDIYEVKDARVHEQFVRDAGFQYYIVSRCRLPVERIFIVTHGGDEKAPFIPNEVTKEAKDFAKLVNDNIWDLNRMQKQPDEIRIEPGEQCQKPYACWYYAYCHDNGGC